MKLEIETADAILAFKEIKKAINNPKITGELAGNMYDLFMQLNSIHDKYVFINNKAIVKFGKKKNGEHTIDFSDTKGMQNYLTEINPFLSKKHSIEFTAISKAELKKANATLACLIALEKFSK